MDNIKFKSIFSECAKKIGFEKAYEGWFNEFSEVIQVLDLQKSNYSDRYYLNIKLYIQGSFGNKYIKSKRLVKTDVGNIFLRQPENYSVFLDLEAPLTEEERKEGLRKMFEDFIKTLSKRTSTKEGVKELHKEGNLFILPAVKEELGI